MDLINISEMADNFYNIFMNIIKMFIIVICFLKESIIITIFIILLDFLYVRLSYKMNKKSAIFFKEQIKENDNLTGLISQTLLGLKDIKTSNINKNLNKNYDNIRKRWQTAYSNKRKYTIIQSKALKNIINIGIIIIYISSIYFIKEKELTIGTMVLLVSYYNIFFNSSTSIMENENTIKEKNISLERIYKILEHNKLYNKKSKI